jgi:MoaD family protein
VKIQFFGGLRGITGTHELDLELEGQRTVREALEALIRRYGGDFRERVIDPATGSPRRFIIITVNERDIRHLQRLETKLGDGDKIAFLPAVAGG